MSNKIEEILKKQEIVILDGGLATEIQDRGYDLNDELWSAKILFQDPDIIEQVHYEYFKAGADIGISASYQASVEGFAKRGYGKEDAEKLVKLSVELVKNARSRLWKELSEEEKAKRPYPVVAGSVGPYAAFFADGSEGRAYDEKVTREDFIRYHRPRIKWLLEAGAEILSVETLPSLKEAQAVLEILKDYPEVYAWFSFNAHTHSEISEGTPVIECARALEGYRQVAAVGVNCVAPELVSDLLREITKATTKPIVVYPNAGKAFDADTKEWLSTSSDLSRQPYTFGEGTKRWHEEGASVIGGCCKTNPENIKEIAAWVRK